MPAPSRPPQPAQPTGTGWYGFNAGSSLSIYNDGYRVASRAAINTTLAPVTNALVTTLILLVKGEGVPLGTMLNSLLGALVAVTGGCAVIDPWGAVVIGGTLAHGATSSTPVQNVRCREL